MVVSASANWSVPHIIDTLHHARHNPLLWIWLPPSTESFNPLSFKLWGKCMEEDGKTHVDASKTIILPYTVWNHSCDSKVHGTTVCLCGSHTDFLCEPLALYWAECKFIIFHVFLYSFASCLCVIKVNIYVNISYVHSADKCNYWLVVKTSWWANH